MGHTRLGRLPRTRQWQEVVGLVETGAPLADVAAATLHASQRGLEDASRDPALVHAFWLLTQLPLCARKPDFVHELARLGISVTGEPSLMELVGGLSDSVDEHVYRNGGRTDLGEMAQMGAAETLASVLGERTATLFGTTPEETQRELANLGTPANFSVLARAFFARLTQRYLTYFLSRELSNSLETVNANREFREALAVHCRQASKIVEAFAKEWFSKANYEGGISRRKAAGFISHALTKISDELRRGAEGGES